MTPVSCDEALALFSDFLAGDCSTSDAEKIESHLEQCESCRLKAAAYCRLDRALAETAVNWRLRGLLEALPMNAADAERTSVPRSHHGRFQSMASRIAAAVVIAVVSAAATYAAPRLHELLFSEQVTLVNPGFEDGLSGWEQFLEIDPNYKKKTPEEQTKIMQEKSKVTTARFRQGKTALELQYGLLGGGVTQRVAHPIPHGAHVKISAWVLMPEAGSRKNKILAFEIRGHDPERDEDWNAHTFHNLTFIGPYPKWTRLEFAAGNLAPSNDFTILIHTSNGDGEDPAHSVYVDDVEVTVLKQ